MMKTAIVHDWLTNYGGAERVIESLHEMFPDAPVYTSVYAPDRLPDSFKKMDIRVSFLQKFPYSKTGYKNYLPIMPLAFEEFDFSQYSLVISNCHSCSKGIIVKPKTLHISYIQTPMRYIWDLYHEYINYEKMNILKKTAIKLMLSRLRIWDRLAAERVDKFICNSDNVKQRIKKYYNKESHIIYPPVETSLFTPVPNPSLNYYLVVSRLVPYKRVDLAVSAFNELGLNLKIAGTGSEYKGLKQKAKSNIRFLGNITDGELKELYANCKALIFGGEEDFGIVPVEVQAAGRPVICYGKGGVTETVIDGQTGVFFHEQTPQSLKEAVNKFEKIDFNPDNIRKNALKFDKKIFIKNFMEFVKSNII